MPDRYGLVQTAAPATEPLSLDELKLDLKVDIADDDDLIKSLGIAARRMGEVMSCRSFITQSWRLSLDYFPGVLSGTIFTGLREWPLFGDLIRLPRAAPLISLDSIKYVDTTGTLQTIDPTLYQMDADAEPARVRPAYAKIWPVPRAQLAAVQVNYTAGYGGAAAVPDIAKAGIKQLVAHWYENRSATTRLNLSSVPMAAETLFMSLWTGSLE